MTVKLNSIQLLTFLSIAGYESEAGAYFSSLVADPSFIGQLEGLATINPSLINSLEALATPQTNIASLTAPPALVTQLPSPYNSILLSVYSHDISIASAHGLFNQAPTGGSGSSNSTNGTTSTPGFSGSAGPSATGSAISTAGAPLATGNSAVIAMGAAAGIIGGVAALL